MPHVLTSARPSCFFACVRAGLTRLVLVRAPGIDDVSTVAIASWLRQLQWLEVRACGLTSAAALPAIGALTQLFRLVLDGHADADLQDEDIMLLAKLTQLRHVYFGDTFSEEAAAAFLRSVNSVHDDVESELSE
jgi:hypothetical protein